MSLSSALTIGVQGSGEKSGMVAVCGQPRAILEPELLVGSAGHGRVGPKALDEQRMRRQRMG